MINLKATKPVALSARALWGIVDTSVIVIASVIFFLLSGAAARARDNPGASDWRIMDIFAPCSGDCGVLVFGGQSFTATSLQKIIFHFIPPSKWQFDNSYFFGVTVSRPLIEYSDWFDIEPEVGIGKRFGDMTEAEFWGAMYFRFKFFPENKYLLTSLALSSGLDYATGISALERKKARGNPSEVMHYFSPEVTFALPSHPQDELVVRIQHRSGAYGVINNASGAQFLTVGIRILF